MKSAKAILLACLGFFLIGGTLFFFVFAHAAWFSKEDAGAAITIEVTNRMSAREVRALLAEKGLVSSFLYRGYAAMDSAANNPQPGSYEFRKGVSYQTIAQTLSRGPVRTERSLRLVEGKTIDENGEALASSGVDAEAYWRLVGRSRDIVPFDRTLVDLFPFLSSLPARASLEGYLFPDTYRVWEDALPRGLVEKQLSEFEERVIKPNPDAPALTGMTWHEIVTLASVVEGEVRTPETRKIVAGIFLNRLNIGMPLQSDATLNYVMSKRNDRPTAQDLAIQSPYNTYDHPGLPPGPVGNPSLSAIDAVLHPTDTDYVYFLTDPEGNVYYAKTYDEHLANKRNVYGN